MNESKHPATKKVVELIDHPVEHTDKKSTWHKKPLLIIVGAFLLSTYIVNYVIGNPPIPHFDNDKQEAQYYESHEQYDKAEQTYQVLLMSDSNNIDWHYKYITCHYLNDDRGKSTDSAIKEHYKGRYGGGGFMVLSDGDTISNPYLARDTTVDSISKSIGWYGYGLCLSLEKNNTEALSAFLMVPTANQKYLNNSLGHVYLQLDSNDRADTCLRKEIALNGYSRGAYTNLFVLLVKERRCPEIEKSLADRAVRAALDSVGLRIAYSTLFNELASERSWGEINRLITTDSTANACCPSDIRRASYFRYQEFGQYISSLYRHYAAAINPLGFAGALLILILWLIYMGQIDLFNSSKFKNVVITCLLGMAFSILVFPVSDYIREAFNWTETGTFFNDVLYFTISVGLLEETVKILPLVIGVFFLSEILEPIDYIIYASVSAIGFGFMENLLYFHHGSLGIMTGRAFSSVFMHIFMSSTIAYSLILGKHQGRSRRNLIAYFLGALIVASFIHGMYDYFLEDGVGSWRLLSILILLIGGIQYGIYLTNALNASPLFKIDKLFDAHRLKLEMIYGFSAILIFEYLAVAFESGSSHANHELISSTLSGGFLVFWLSNRLGAIGLHQARGEWFQGLGATIVRGVVSVPVKEALASLLHVGIYFIFGAMVVYGSMSSKLWGGVYVLRIIMSYFGKKKKVEAVPPEEDHRPASLRYHEW